MRMLALALVCAVAVGCAAKPVVVEQTFVEPPKKVVVARKPVAKKAVVVAAKPVAKKPVYVMPVVPPTAGGGGGWR